MSKKSLQGIDRVARRSLLLHRVATLEQPGWVPRFGKIKKQKWNNKICHDGCLGSKKNKNEMIKSAWLIAKVLESKSELTKKKTSYHNNYHLSYQLNQSINQQSVYLVPSHPGSQRRAGLWASWSRDCLGCSMWRGCRSSHSGRADDYGTVHELADCG